VSRGYVNPVVELHWVITRLHLRFLPDFPFLRSIILLNGTVTTPYSVSFLRHTHTSEISTQTSFSQNVYTENDQTRWFWEHQKNLFICLALNVKVWQCLCLFSPRLLSEGTNKDSRHYWNFLSRLLAFPRKWPAPWYSPVRRRVQVLWPFGPRIWSHCADTNRCRLH
jgi:hypothetical protein